MPIQTDAFERDVKQIIDDIADYVAGGEPDDETDGAIRKLQVLSGTLNGALMNARMPPRMPSFPQPPTPPEMPQAPAAGQPPQQPPRAPTAPPPRR